MLLILQLWFVLPSNDKLGNLPTLLFHYQIKLCKKHQLVNPFYDSICMHGNHVTASINNMYSLTVSSYSQGLSPKCSLILESY